MGITHDYLNTTGFKPLASELDVAELSVNFADGTLWSKNPGGTVVEIAGGGAGSSFIPFNFVATNNQTVFSVTYSNATLVSIFIDGIKAKYSDDYTLSGGTTLTLVEPAETGTLVNAQVFTGDGVYVAPESVDTDVVATSASQTVFLATYEPTRVIVYIDGVVQHPDTYTATNGTSITLDTGVDIGTWIRVTSNDAGAVAGTINWANVTSTPTTLTGYGITDGASLTGANTWSALNTYSVGTIMPNNAFHSGKTVGGATRTLIGMNVSNQVAVGSSSHELLLDNSGTIDADDGRFKNADAVGFGSTLYNLGTLTSTITFNPQFNQYTKMTLGGNVTASFFTLDQIGTYYIHIHQDATGGRTLTLPSGKWVGGTAKALTTTANAHDLLMIHHYGGQAFVYELMLDLS